LQPPDEDMRDTPLPRFPKRGPIEALSKQEGVLGFDYAFRASPSAAPLKQENGVAAGTVTGTLPRFPTVACIIIAHQRTQLLLLLPGLIAVPVYSLIPAVTGAIPFSRPTEEAKSASRGLAMIAVMFVAMILAGVSTWLWTTSWFWQFLVIESAISLTLYLVLHRSLSAVPWPAIE
jgi:hypothetical protein